MTADKEQVRAIIEQHERDVSRVHGARYRGDRFMQPLHHHSWSSNYKSHQRDKLRSA